MSIDRNRQLILAEDDLVAIHYHWVVEPGVFERAIVDIFRIENGKLVEHWDVVQQMPDESVVLPETRRRVTS